MLVYAVSSNLNVGLGSGLTIEGWINPTSVANAAPLAEYERVLGSLNVADLDVHFYLSILPTGVLPGNVYANVVDSSGGQHPFGSGSNVVSNGVWHHVALTYDKASEYGRDLRQWRGNPPERISGVSRRKPVSPICCWERGRITGRFTVLRTVSLARWMR